MKVELLYSPGCKQCDTARGGLKAAAEQACVGAAMEWQELNVLEHLDYAVELGVLTLPAVAIDGELVYASLPAPRELIVELSNRIRRNRQ